MPSILPNLQAIWNLTKERMNISEMEWVSINGRIEIETRKNNYPTEPLTQYLLDNIIEKYEGELNRPRRSGTAPTLQAPEHAPQGIDCFWKNIYEEIGIFSTERKKRQYINVCDSTVRFKVGTDRISPKMTIL